ncbi:MAG: hypothetical protein ABIP94_17345 [Planctomycetota bacterium]
MAALVLALPTIAQCDLQWQPGDPVSMPRGNVLATTGWDPDGTGPLPSVLVAAGSFTVGNATAMVATFDGSQWTAIAGAQFNGAVTAIAVYNGALVIAAAGSFHRYSGSTWQQIGTYAVSINSPSVSAMAVFGTDLVAAGRFDTCSGFTANNIARWNGTTWSPLGTGVSGAIYALAVYSHQGQNALYVGGSLTSAGGVSTSNLAIWTGTTWAATAGCNSYVRALAVRWSTTAAGSFLFVGGNFTAVGTLPVNRVARYNSSTNTWTAMGALAATGDPCSALFVRGSQITYSVVATQRAQAWLWSGSAWNLMGPALETGPSGTVESKTIATLWYFGGRYVVGLEDYWGLVGGVCSFDGVAWQSMDGTGIDRKVNAVVTSGTDLVIGGQFRAISGVTMNGVAIGNQGNWQPLGSGVTGGNGEVLALARLPNGDLVAGGSFTVASGGVADRIARWNGSAWQPMGTGMSGTVFALAVLPGGELVAGGSFSVAGGISTANIARWNGSVWSGLGGGCAGSVVSLLVQSNGDLVAGGFFLTAGSGATTVNRIARWSGGSWHAFGTGVDNGVRALAQMPNGEIVAGGDFTMAGGGAAGRLARWNGTAWQGLPGGGGTPLTRTVRTLLALPNGDLMVGGDIFQSFGDCLLRLRGTQWTYLGLGRGVFDSSPDVVQAAAVTANGDIVVGGYFHNVVNLVSANVARLAVTCPASAVAYGSGCAGSSGVNTLTSTALPWSSSTQRARATGLPAQCFAVVVYGFAPISVPINALLPEGLPGCDLLTTLDSVAIGVPTGGGLDTAVFITPTPSLIGLTFYHQVAAFELNASLVTAISITNGLRLTVGSY